MKERAIVFVGMENGEKTMDHAITRLELVESTAETKETPVDGDEIPVIDSADGKKMKKSTFANVKKAIRSDIAGSGVLINPFFSVWQRGTSFEINSTNWTYTADRWRCKGSGTVSKSSVTNEMKFSGATNLQYVMENSDFKAIEGKDVTLSYSKNGVIQPSSTFTATSATVVDLNLVANDRLQWVKLELGSVATAFVPRSYAEELASCRRYYQSYQAVNMTAAKTNIGAGAWDFSYLLPIEMRTTPSSTASIEVLWFNGTAAAYYTSISYCQAFNNRSFDISVANASVGVATISINDVRLDAEIYGN